MKKTYPGFKVPYFTSLNVHSKMINVMQINYLGHSCFKIKGKNSTLLTDPFDKFVGFPMPKTKAEIVTISHQHKDHNCLDNIEGEPFIIQAPGEYEVGDVSVFSLKTFHDDVKGAQRGTNVIYNIQMEDISLCHLGDLGHKLNDRQLEKVNGVDVLFVPVGGVFTLGPKQVIEVINQIEPAIIIPMHYRTSRHDQDKFGKLFSLKDFLAEIGAPEAQAQEKLVISKTSLPEESEVIPLVCTAFAKTPTESVGP